jgi:protein TonB
MRELFPRSFTSLSRSTDSWLQRVADNFRQMLTPMRFQASTANGAPIHLLERERSKRPAWAQGYSVIFHVGMLGLILFALNRPGVIVGLPLEKGATQTFTAPDALRRFLNGSKPAQGIGGGGNHDPLPAKSGNLAPLSSIQIVRPTLPTREHHELEVAPTIFDANAAAILRPTPEIGLPWMKDATNSPGGGKGHSIGDGEGPGMGDKNGPSGGNSEVAGPYRVGGSQPMCAYCPDPLYTDAARESKLQGTVTLQVLVGTDGRAQRIQLVKGIGMGLDEHALEAVKRWKFVPAHDGAKRPVAEWVTIETIFRLF